MAHGPSCPRHVKSSQMRARTCVPYIGRQVLIHCTTREVPKEKLFKGSDLMFLLTVPAHLSIPAPSIPLPPSLFSPSIPLFSLHVDFLYLGIFSPSGLPACSFCLESHLTPSLGKSSFQFYATSPEKPSLRSWIWVICSLMLVFIIRYMTACCSVCSAH